ncbi:hypothetical protein ACTXT7_015647, partial [Hymenolepis weldensis]
RGIGCIVCGVFNATKADQGILAREPEHSGKGARAADHVSSMRGRVQGPPSQSAISIRVMTAIGSLYLSAAIWTSKRFTKV